jgi:hypothetical protein
MPRKPFPKGNKLGGRKKGVPNKFTSLKAAFVNVLQELGGEEFIRTYAKSKLGKHNFMRAIASMLPRDIEVSGKNGAPLIPPVLQIMPVKPYEPPTNPDIGQVSGSPVGESPVQSP